MPELIDSSFQTKYSEKSPCKCDCVNEETITYKLKFEIGTTTNHLNQVKNQWWAWFESKKYAAKTIGYRGGLGEDTLEEAIAGAMKAKEEYLTT